MSNLGRTQRSKRAIITTAITAAVAMLAGVIWLAPDRGASAGVRASRTIAVNPAIPANPNAMLSTPPWPAKMRMTEGPLQMVMLHLTGKQPTWAEISKVYAMLSAGKAATAKYRDLRVAERDGYYTAGWLDVPSQGYHYINDNYTPEAMPAFDPTKPWILVYNKVHGRMTLSGVLYGMPANSTPEQLAAVFPASMASWHQHINLCLVPSQVLPIHDQATCLAHHARFLARTQWVVHAWFWQPGSVPAFAMDRT